MKLLLAVALLSATLSASAAPLAPAPFNSSTVSLVRSFFMLNVNIDGKGGVVASPDRTTPGGSYYFHWMRDGALSMHALMKTASSLSSVQGPMQSYVQWVLGRQSDPDPHGQDVRTEPKFNLPNGGVFTGPWCRPQTDGPGLRAITLILYGNALMQQQGNTGKAYVQKYLWTSSNSSYKGGAVKFDLDWVAANWQQSGCDLWEEIQSNDFFWNRFMFRKALYLGEAFAQQLGDSASAARYKAAGDAISNVIGQHYNGQFIFETQNRQKDGAVIVALNDGYLDDGVFGPTDSSVANTINVYSQLFTSAFPINGHDTSNGVPGVLYGRYEGDHYAGGNPWILTTNALAQLYYRGAADVLKKGKLPPQADLAAWQPVLKISYESMATMDHLGFARALTSAGDGVLIRVRYHVAGGGYHMSEQLDKNTGFEMSATDLTWSYATFLKAAQARAEVESLYKMAVNGDILPNNSPSVRIQ